MPKIAGVESGCYRVPLPVVLSDSTHGEMTHFELITVRVRDTDGAEGVGYTYTVGRSGARDPCPLRATSRRSSTGEDAERIEPLWQRMWWALHYGGRGGPAVLAISAVDIALWDLKAQRAGQPLWRLLGGYDPRVPCYAGGIDLEFPLDGCCARPTTILAQGFRAIKMKVGRDRLSEDVERVRAMREHLGDGFPLMADANMKWTVDEAIRAARLLRELELVWLEEPTIPDDVAGHARIVREGGVPIATGENIRTLWEFRQMIAAGGVTYPEPDVTNCGGVTVFMKVAHLAEAFNLPVTSHGAHDVTVHLLAAVPNRTYLETHGFGLDRYIAEPMRIDEASPSRPTGPGTASRSIGRRWRS